MDFERANSEGWTFRNGTITRTFDSRGFSKFASDFELMLYIQRQANMSEWHLEVYMSLPWLLADYDSSKREGWTVSFFGLCIETWSLQKFASDEDALNYVTSRAEAGNALAKKALTLIAAARLGLF